MYVGVIIFIVVNPVRFATPLYSTDMHIHASKQTTNLMKS